MAYRLSLLDKALIPEGLAPAEALANTVALVQRAEDLGYHRYWFAEHHGMVGLASSAPEVLAAYVLGRTNRIRVGTGGVMLQHYAPYKVAESFNLLASLAPGRVDLGVGRAPGGMPQATRALYSDPAAATPAPFAQKLAELDAFLDDRLPDGHPLAGAVAAPRPPEPAERILLGASVESAEAAGRLGWQYCYAGHFDGDPARIDRVFTAYRALTGRTPLFSVIAFAAQDDAEASRLVGGFRFVRVTLPTGQSVNVLDHEGAAEFARQSGADSFETEELRPHIISGSAARVKAELDRLHAAHGIEEFVLDAPVAGFAERRASQALLARAVFEHSASEPALV